MIAENDTAHWDTQPSPASIASALPSAVYVYRTRDGGYQAETYRKQATVNALAAHGFVVTGMQEDYMGDAPYWLVRFDPSPAETRYWDTVNASVIRRDRIAHLRDLITQKYQEELDWYDYQIAQIDAEREAREEQIENDTQAYWEWVYEEMEDAP